VKSVPDDFPQDLFPAFDGRRLTQGLVLAVMEEVPLGLLHSCSIGRTGRVESMSHSGTDRGRRRQCYLLNT